MIGGRCITDNTISVSWEEPSLVIVAQGTAHSRLVLPRNLIGSLVDAASLVMKLHGEVLRTCPLLVQEYFQGLAQAGRYLRSGGLISPKDSEETMHD